MPYCIGTHPGLKVPFESSKGSDFSDYSLLFDQPERQMCIRDSTWAIRFLMVEKAGIISMRITEKMSTTPMQEIIMEYSGLY